MLRLIPAPVHRTGLRLAHRIRMQWWRIARPRVAGCRVLALDGEDRLLLVRQAYGSGRWMPPGGGLRRGEDPLAAGARELLEETGCRLTGAVLVAVVEEQTRGACNAVRIVAGRTGDAPRPDGREVIEAGFFPIDALPRDMTPHFRANLADWVTAAIAAHRRDGPALPQPPPARKG